MPLFSFPRRKYFFSFPHSQSFLSFSPLFFQVCPAQRLWTTNGADRQGTARPATSTGDTDYLWIVGQCGDSARHRMSLLFAKQRCLQKQSVLAPIKFLRNLLLGLQMRCEERIGVRHLLAPTWTLLHS